MARHRAAASCGGLRLLLIGENFAAARTLEVLQGIEVVEVVGVACDQTAGSQQLARRSESLGIPVLPIARLNQPDGVGAVRRVAPDIGLNVNSLTIFGGALLSSFPHGAVNFHPGPLPEYSGLNVHQWAIINGERQHAVTFHRMEPRIDAGDVLIRAAVPVETSDTGLKLFMRCIHAGTNLIAPLIDGLVRQTLTPRPQDLSRRRYYGRGPYRWEVDFTWPASWIVDLVRALDYRPFESPLGSPCLRVGNRFYVVPTARVAAMARTGAPGEIVGWVDEDTPVFACGDDTLVAIPELVSEGQSFRAGDVLVAGTGRPVLR